MSMHRFRAPVGALCAAALCLIALPAKAQTIQPGLWEVQTQMQGGDPAMAARAAEAQKRLANLPPEQRKMVESMMGNMKIQPSSDGTNFSMKLCLTKEMVERDHIPQQKEQHGCKKHLLAPIGWFGEVLVSVPRQPRRWCDDLCQCTGVPFKNCHTPQQGG